MPPIQDPPARMPGICYAATDAGEELPVIDVTHPAFRVEATRADLQAALQTHVQRLERRSRIPAFLRRLYFRLAGRNSALARAVLGGDGRFLGGMATYLLKLGPAHLGPGHAGSLDRQVAGSFPALAARIRLQEAARHLAFGLAPALAARRGPLCILNIAGGPASDSLNALILLRRDHPGCLEGRAIRIQVLDLQAEAPRFGQRSLEALCAPGGPLHGLSISFDHLAYDWADTRVLREALVQVAPDAVVAVSSEGGLFQYASDEVIKKNLEALRAGTPRDAVLVGSVSWNSPLTRRSRSFSRFAVRDFERGAFVNLVARAGWRLDLGIPSPTFQVVSLRHA